MIRICQESQIFGASLREIKILTGAAPDQLIVRPSGESGLFTESIDRFCNQLDDLRRSSKLNLRESSPIETRTLAPTSRSLKSFRFSRMQLTLKCSRRRGLNSNSARYRSRSCRCAH
jgi:hypothetical protein